MELFSTYYYCQPNSLSYRRKSYNSVKNGRCLYLMKHSNRLINANNCYCHSRNASNNRCHIRLNVALMVENVTIHHVNMAEETCAAHMENCFGQSYLCGNLFDVMLLNDVFICIKCLCACVRALWVES